MDKSVSENRVTYRRKVSNVKSWQTFTPEHLAFAFHRITGWLLLAWVGVHLTIPAITTGPTDVYLPRSSELIVFLIAILVFHGFNGVRLLVAELFGVGIANARRVFYGTLAAAMALIVLSGVLI